MKRLWLTVLALAVLGKGASAQAQGFDFADPHTGKGAPPDIQIYADDGLEWQSDQTMVVAHGNAKAVRGDMTVTADQLTAYYRNGGQAAGQPGAAPAPAAPAPVKNAGAAPPATGPSGGSQIWRVDADGHVTLASPTDTATGTKAIYDLDKAVLVLKGHPALLTTPTETYSADDQLEYWEEDHMAVLRGNAVATGKDKKIQADVLTAHFKDHNAPGAARPAKTAGKASGSSGNGGGMELSRADAYGHVIVTTTQDVVTGDRGDYNAETGIVTLTGNVHLTRGNNVLNGGYAHVDLNTGISTLFGNPAGDPNGKARAEGTFIPEPGGKVGPKAQGGTPAGGDRSGGEQRTPLFTGKGAGAKNGSGTSSPAPESTGADQTQGGQQ